MNFLVKMAERQPTMEERLQEMLDNLPVEELRKLAHDNGVCSPTGRLDHLSTRIKQAEAMGREMAHVHGHTLEKQAWIGPALAMAGRLAAGAGGRAALGTIAKGVAKDYAVNKVVGAVGNALKPAAQPAQQAGQSVAGAFKYANLASTLVKTVGTTGKGNSLLRSAAGTMMRHPTAATAIAGGAIGAAKGMISDPGYDEQGNKKSRLGAAVRGGAVGAGVGAAAGHFIPGAGKAVQGMGKSLSGELRGMSHSWSPRPAAAGAAPAASAAPAAAAGAAPVARGPGFGINIPRQSPAAQAQMFSDARAKRVMAGNPYNEPIGRNTAASIASNVAQQGGIKVPLEMQDPARVKIADVSYESGSASSAGGEGWLSQFEGTPLLSQAIQLEEQSLQLEMEDMQRRQAQEEMDRQRRAEQEGPRRAIESGQDKVRMQRRVMMLELAKHKAGLDAQAAAAQTDPQQQGQPDPTMQPQGPEPGMSAPNDANPTMGKMAFMIGVRRLRRS